MLELKKKNKQTKQHYLHRSSALDWTKSIFLAEGHVVHDVPSLLRMDQLNHEEVHLRSQGCQQSRFFHRPRLPLLLPRRIGNIRGGWPATDKKTNQIDGFSVKLNKDRRLLYLYYILANISYLFLYWPVFRHWCGQFVLSNSWLRYQGMVGSLQQQLPSFRWRTFWSFCYTRSALA